MKTHPHSEFLIYSRKVYYNQREHPSGSFVSNVLMVPDGYVSLYEMNVDRPGGSIIYPFITKDGSRTSFNTISTSQFNTQFLYGDTLSGSYSLSASITRYYFDSTSRARVSALQNSLDYHSRLSPHYQYSSSFGDKSSQTLNLLSIPSIFYGSSMKKGSLELKFYITGTLIGQLKDENKNGELIQVGPSGSTGSGSVAGVVMYDEGFIVLTASWGLDPHSIDYISDPTNLKNSSWIYFAVGANDGSTAADNSFSSASYIMSFDGTEKIPTITMLANAPQGELNYSNEPTFIQSSSVNSQNSINTSSNSYSERRRIIKNTISSSYTDPNASFEKQVFITQIAIYDEDKKVIGIASLANPVKKKEDNDYTFKLKLDL